MAFHHWLKGAGASLLAVLTLLAGCDEQRIRELEEGVSTEQDVRARFGEPEQVWRRPTARAPWSTTASRPGGATT